MNSNPFPSAFVNCKASLQVLPVTIPSSQAFIQWRIDLLTELENVTHMTKAIDDIMVVGLTSRPSCSWLPGLSLCWQKIMGIATLPQLLHMICYVS